MGRSRRNDTYKPAKPATAAAPPAGRFADQLLTCERCGRQFVFTVEQQRRQADLGLPIEAPSLCPVCAPADYGAPVSERQPDRREEAPPAPVAAAPSAPPPYKSERAPARSSGGKHERQESGAGFTVRSLGHVKWYDEERGYGFIVDDETGQEFFVHQSALESGAPALFEGQAVEFEVTHRQKGPEAVYILTL
ncbi:MAG: cold shock domain-containing protein [Anaerolineae bacterium]